MNDDEASIGLFFRIVAGFMVVIAGMGCFVIALTSSTLHGRCVAIHDCGNCGRVVVPRDIPALGDLETRYQWTVSLPIGSYATCRYQRDKLKVQPTYNMTAEQSADALKRHASDAGVRITLTNLESPVGRKPSAAALQRSQWFHDLSEQDRKVLIKVRRLAAESAVFGVLTVLEGSRVVEDSAEKGDFELYYVRNGERMRLNDAVLHDY
jgi:hypothetical protein